MYELKKTITDTQKADFIVEYNHNQGLRIDEGSDTYTVGDLTLKGEFIFALEANEIMDTVEAEIDVPDEVEEQTYHKETAELYKPVVDPDWGEKEKEKEKERIGKLQITKRVFMLGLQQMGITYSQLKEHISTNEQAQMEWDLCERLQRNNPLIDTMAESFGISAKDIDNIFVNTAFGGIIQK